MRAGWKASLLLGVEKQWHRVRKALRWGFGWLSHPLVRRISALTLTLGAVASLVLLLHANWETLKAWQWQVRPVPLVLSFVAYTVALGTAVLVWGQMMNTLGPPIGWQQHIRIYCITNLARRLPGALWYVAGRILLYDERDASKAVISVGSGLELVLVALSGLGVGIMTWSGSVSRLLHPLWVVGGLVLGLLVIHPRLLHTLLRRLGAGNETREGLRYRQVLGWLSLYGIDWLMGGLVLFALIEALYPVPLEWLPRTIGAWSLSGMVAVVATFLPVGLGLRELTLGLMLASFLPEGIALVIAILARLLTTLYELIWALITYWGVR